MHPSCAIIGKHKALQDCVGNPHKRNIPTFENLRAIKRRSNDDVRQIDSSLTIDLVEIRVPQPIDVRNVTSPISEAWTPIPRRRRQM